MIKVKIIDQTDWKKAEEELEEFLDDINRKEIVSITQSECYSEGSNLAHLTITAVVRF